MPKTQKPTRRPIRILRVGLDPKSHQALARALKNEPGFELLSPFKTSMQAIDSLRHCAEDAQPDIILFDPSLAGTGGLAAIPLFDAAVPAAKLVIHTHSDLEADIFAAIKHGVAGYFLKSSPLPQLIDGFRRVWEGDALLDPRLTKFTLSALQSRLPALEETKPLLSPRELEVLKLLAAGYAKKDIAKQLYLSTTTVITHATHIYQKMKVSNAPAAVTQAYKLGIFLVRILLIMCCLQSTANAAIHLPSGRLFHLLSQPAALS
jgi:DNA-binding NarL/FixJ family response regulator